MAFHIAVRTYERPDLFHTHTLRTLQLAGLTDLLTVFVGSDIQPYKDKNPDLRYIQVPKGGHNAIRAICEYYPRDTPIFFMDDDLEPYFQYNPDTDSFDAGNLRERIQDGFQRIAASRGMFSFYSIKNKLWLRGSPVFKEAYSTIYGCYFGAYNEPELITTEIATCDDLLRTIQYWKQGRSCYVFMGAGFKTRYGLNPGGLQSSGDRADTKAICFQIYPSIKEWVRDDLDHHFHIYRWRLKPWNQIKKLILAARSRACQNPSPNPSAGLQS